MHPTHPACLRAAAALVFALGAVLLADAPALAQPKRVVVESFRGPAAGRVRAQLLADLQRRDELEVVSRTEVRRAARELGIRGSNYSEDEYVQIARELNVAAFIDGRTTRRRRRWAVTVRVRSGADGMVLGSESWGGRTIGALGAVRRNGYSRLRSYLDAAQSPAPEIQRPQQQVVQATDGETPWYAVGTDAEDPLENEELEEDDFGTPVDEDSRQDALRVSVLAGSLRRSMAARAVVLNYCDPMLPGGGPSSPICRDTGVASTTIEEDRTYQSGGLGHMEAGIAAELYPGAFGDDQEIPWFGLLASYRHSLFLRSVNESSTGELIDIPTTQSELYIGARGRYRFGEARRDAEAIADIGYGNFSFELDPEALKQIDRSAILPPVSYSYLMLGAGLSYGVVPVYLRLGFEASWRLGLGIGREAKEIWGTQTTDMSGWSLAATVHSEAPYVADGIFVALRVEYFQFTTTYRGQASCVEPSGDMGCDNTDLWEPWPYEGDDAENVTGGIRDPVTDSYFRLGVAIGYALR